MSLGAEIIFEGREENFSTPQYRAALRDARLTWGARGLFSFLWDLPRGWRLRSSHLAEMAPDGRDAVRSRLAELREVGALKFEKIKGRAGRLGGSQWVVVSPKKWARETSLEPAKTSDDTGSRKTRLSEESEIGEADAKVHQGEGSPKKGSSILKTTTPTPPPADNSASGGGLSPTEIQQHIAAAIWAEERDGRPIKTVARFSDTVRQRVSVQPNLRDLETLSDFLRYQQKASSEKELQRQRCTKKAASEAAELEKTRRELDVLRQRDDLPLVVQKLLLSRKKTAKHQSRTPYFQVG